MTTELADLLRHDPPPVSAVRATVANTPASIDDDLFVVVQAFDGSRQHWGPCRWVPANGLPAEGDECLLVLTEDDGTPWALTTAPVYAGGSSEDTLARFQCQAGLAVPADSWTAVPATDLLSQLGGDSFVLVTTGPNAGGLQCVSAGVYAITASAAFSAAQQVGERAVRVYALTAASLYGLIEGTPTVKAQVMPVIAGGEVFVPEGQVLGLQVFSDTATTLDATDALTWVSFTRIGTGVQGETGEQGPTGPPGATGAQGNPGPPGAAGATGATGPQGPPGADSTVPGPQGPPGPQGDVGATGPQGPQGNTGPTGATGPQGPKGDTGATGPQGPQGVPGTPGAPPKLNPTYADLKAGW